MSNASEGELRARLEGAVELIRRSVREFRHYELVFQTRGLLKLANNCRKEALLREQFLASLREEKLELAEDALEQIRSVQPRRTYVNRTGQVE